MDSEEFFAEPTGQVGALFTPDAGFVDDPRLVCVNFARAAVRRGTRLEPGRRVVAIDQLPGGTWAVTSADGDQWFSPLVVNAAGPWSGAVNALAGVGGDFTVTTRPLRGEVHTLLSAPDLGRPGILAPCLGDPDLGYYLRPQLGSGVLVGTMEPACDPLEWLDDADEANLDRTAEAFTRQVTRAARRFPHLAVPNRPSGLAGVYDVTPDWTPIYDQTERPGFYVAIGTSGNQFKNAPVVGELMAELIGAVEEGLDHGRTPLQHRGPRPGLPIDLATFSRLRGTAHSVGSVLG